MKRNRPSGPIRPLPPVPSVRVSDVARAARRELEAMSHPAGEFDGSRYFRAADDLQFFNVGSPNVRAFARRLVQDHPEWTVDEAMAFAEALIADPVLEVKEIGRAHV